MRRSHLEEVTTYRTGLAATDPRSRNVQTQMVYHRLPPQIANNQVIRTRLEEVFLERYLPSRGNLGWTPPIVYMREIVLSPRRGPALNISFHALWMTRLGYMTRNPDLYASGTQCYGKALRWLMQRLSDADPSLDDEVIVTAHLLSCYEVCLLYMKSSLLLIDIA